MNPRNSEIIGYHQPARARSSATGMPLGGAGSSNPSSSSSSGHSLDEIAEVLQKTCAISLTVSNGRTTVKNASNAADPAAATNFIRTSLSSTAEFGEVVSLLASLWLATVKPAELAAERKSVLSGYASALLAYPGDVVANAIVGWTDLEEGDPDFPTGGRFWPSLSDLKMLCKHRVRHREAIIDQLRMLEDGFRLPSRYCDGSHAEKLDRARQTLQHLAYGHDNRPLDFDFREQQMSAQRWAEVRPLFIGELENLLAILKSTTELTDKRLEY